MPLWSFIWKIPRLHGVSRGIEANPKKVKAILDMVSPKTVKEVQRLTRRVAALNRFVLKAIDKCLPFFKFLKQAF